jgi:hypothetical protein
MGDEGRVEGGVVWDSQGIVRGIVGNRVCGRKRDLRWMSRIGLNFWRRGVEELEEELGKARKDLVKKVKL